MNIYQRIAKVMEKVAYIRKDKKVDTYMAVTHDAVTAEVRPQFVEFGIVIVPTQISGKAQETGMTTARGNPIIRYEAGYDIAFVNVDEPSDRIVVHVESHALDQGDKAPGKAMSYATKYAILKLLMIETGEGDEGRVVVGHEEPPRPNTATQVAVDAFAAMGAEEQDFLRTHANTIKKMHANGEVVGDYIIEQKFDNEEKLAIWSLLPSNVRSAIKKQTKPSNGAELATQA